MIPDWVERQACRGSDPSVFFPDRGGDPDPEAQRLCASCPVREECLSEALRLGDVHGYRGGVNGPERLRILKATPKSDVPAEIRRLRGLSWTVAAVCLRLGVSDYQVHRAMTRGRAA